MATYRVHVYRKKIGSSSGPTGMTVDVRAESEHDAREMAKEQVKYKHPDCEVLAEEAKKIRD